MPTYEYRCPEGHEFDRFQKMSDPPVAECPECGADAERLLSAGAGLIFKGSGFYITDYRDEGYKKAAEAEKGGGADGGGDGSAGSDGAAASADGKPGKGKGKGKGEGKGTAESGSGSGSTSATSKKDATGGGE